MNISLLELWSTMGWFARGIVFVLLAMSIVAATVGVQRARTLRRARRATLKFAGPYAEALRSGDFERAERLVEEHGDSHLAASYRRVFATLSTYLKDGRLSAAEIAAAERVVELNKLEQLARFRRGLGALATIGATAPFVGLLGTTIGVVNAFTGMATAGSGGLSAISAGIAEALVTTAIGLFVAIPAVWLYNYFVNRIELIDMEIDYGSKEFMDFLLRLESRGGRPSDDAAAVVLQGAGRGGADGVAPRP